MWASWRAIEASLGLTRPNLDPRRREAVGAPAKFLQINPSKSKQIQIKPRKKAWISLDSFGGIWTFQRVTANPNKNFPFSISSVAKCLNWPQHSSVRRVAETSRS
jgi:hypothetical protein